MTTPDVGIDWASAAALKMRLTAAAKPNVRPTLKRLTLLISEPCLMSISAEVLFNHGRSFGSGLWERILQK